MIGDTDQRVLIERRVLTRDLAGGALTAWEPVAYVWAKVEPRASGEDQDAEGRRALTRYDVTIRRRTDTSPGMRVVWRNQNLYLRTLRDAGPKKPYMIFSADDGDPL